MTGCWTHSSAVGHPLQVTWRPPTKNADHITSFKLMMATTTGVVRDVYTGMATQSRTLGLHANAEYIFCVKANYVSACLCNVTAARLSAVCTNDLVGA